MHWKFWQRQATNGQSPTPGGEKLPKPKELPQQIGMFLVVNDKLDPDYVWTLKCVVRPRPERKRYFDFRIFDPAQAANAKLHVVNYTSLDNYPELVLFKGRYDKDVRDPEMDREPPFPKAA